MYRNGSLVLIALMLAAAGLSACGPSKEDQDSKAARLDRELRQSKESLAAGPLEVRTESFEKAIAEAETRQALAELDEHLAQNRGRTSEEIEARKETLRRLLKTLEGDDTSAKPE